MNGPLAIRANRALSSDFYRMDLECASGEETPAPGQFVMIRTRETTDPIWRRPFGVHDFRRLGASRVLSILYQVVGPTTRDLAALERGDTVNLLGPFGRGFDLEAGEHCLLAGGRGVAPLFFLARSLRRRRVPVLVMIGGRGAGHVLCVEAFERLGCPVQIATDDGSRGKHGPVTALLERHLAHLSAHRKKSLLISACGPQAMLKIAADLAAAHGVAAQVSVDPLLACGQGLCLGCSVPGKDGLRLACRQGPVFRSEDLRW